MKNPRVWLLIGLLVVVGVVGLVAFNSSPSNKQKLGQRTQELADQTLGLTGPILRSERELSVVPTLTSKPMPTVAPVVREDVVRPMPIRLYTGGPSNPEPEPLGDYAPFGRLVKCELVNTVDSSSIATPLIGLVSEDVVWNGKVIVPRRSEAHGVAQIDKVRERIASEGPFTFILNDPQNPGLGRELVVDGIALDREEDAELKTFGITDGSAGLRGVVIQTDKLADIKLFVATFLSGIGQGLQSTTTNGFGTVQNNPNGNTAGIPGYIINPITSGAQAVLNQYADHILQTIERDGFFVRVQAGKQFYIYVRQVIDLNKAVVDGDPVRVRVKKEYLNERSQEENITQPRRERDEVEAKQRGLESAQNYGVSHPQIDQLRSNLERANQELNELNQGAQPQASPGTTRSINN
jgi:hypothetical protein